MLTDDLWHINKSKKKLFKLTRVMVMNVFAKNEHIDLNFTIAPP